MKKLGNGDEVSVGEKTYRVVNDELFVVLDKEPPKETQLDRIERRLGELEEKVSQLPTYIPYAPYPTYPTYPTWIGGSGTGDVIPIPSTTWCSDNPVQ